MTDTLPTDLAALADKWQADGDIALLAGEGDKHCALHNCADDLRALASRDGGGWISVADRLPAYGVPCHVGWTSAPWLKEPTPAVYAQAVCRDYAGDDSWGWFEWQGGKWPVGDDCEWDAESAPTHWQPFPEPPAKAAPLPGAVGVG